MVMVMVVFGACACLVRAVSMVLAFLRFLLLRFCVFACVRACVRVRGREWMEWGLYYICVGGLRYSRRRDRQCGYHVQETRAFANARGNKSSLLSVPSILSDNNST